MPRHSGSLSALGVRINVFFATDEHVRELAFDNQTVAPSDRCLDIREAAFWSPQDEAYAGPRLHASRSQPRVLGRGSALRVGSAGSRRHHPGHESGPCLCRFAAGHRPQLQAALSAAAAAKGRHGGDGEATGL